MAAIKEVMRRMQAAIDTGDRPFTIDVQEWLALLSSDNPDLQAAITELKDWKTGNRSWTNLGPMPPHTPDVIAVMDAQEVVKLSAYIQALCALERRAVQ